MDDPPAKKPLIKGPANFLPVAAFVVVCPAFNQGRTWIEHLATTDAEIRADIERKFQTDFKTFQALKEHFPQKYEALLASTVQDARNGATTEDAVGMG